MNTTERGPISFEQAQAMRQHEITGPTVGASQETNTEAGVYLTENGDGSLIMDLPFLEALANAENPHWDGCIGEATARRLARNYREIEARLREIFALSRKHECFVPSREAERWILTGIL